MVIDAHLHCSGQENGDAVLRSLDEAGIDQAVLLAPFLSPGYALDDAVSLRRGNRHLARLVRGRSDRLVGLAVVDPRCADAPAMLRQAVDEGLSGAKMVPSGWYPYDASVQATFEVAAALQLPVLFHSGIFIDGRSGRFCRPCFFEALRVHQGLRVVLAHLGWPWVDEALAVGLIDRINQVPAEQFFFRFDLSFGPPAPYRLDALRLALEVLGPDMLQFGSDCFLPCSGAHLAERRQLLQSLLDELGVDADSRRRIWSGTALAWLRRPSRPAAGTAPESAAPPNSAAPREAGQRLALGARRWTPVCC